MTASGHPQIPLTKNARQQRIIELLATAEVKSQTELADLLVDAGVHVTQATLSRDLVELDAVKVRVTSGALVYAVPRSWVGSQPPRKRGWRGSVPSCWFLLTPPRTW
jgi:arginine repressor